jgi:acetyl esterase/lipase
MFFHGGGWTAGAKEEVALNLLPYLEAEWTVLNVEYRLTNRDAAPSRPGAIGEHPRVA